MALLQKGDKAPAFSLKNQHGQTVRLSDFKGKKLVLFFYPEDMTPTCTIEACNLRDHYAELQEAGMDVVGISPDTSERHTLFIEKHQLPYTLLADTRRTVIEKYGAWGEKNLYGHRFMGVLRSTFLIDEEGRIVEIIRKVLSAKHARQILDKWNPK
ncbi:MAG TPA: thioredoxin-dependent thiol peroxidase [Chitinophagaceae bacterium]|nr:thioredoxin-dependent thiol peroxidase [Chitinophagaceae bacterium]HNF70843.1 thioredoxin-dependent thiol peroxidase [Chitinophagaceae bacterium]